MTAVILSQHLLFAIKANQSFDHLVKKLSENPGSTLTAELADKNSRMALWLNLYNAFVQILIGQQYPDFSNWRKRIHFFDRKSINVSGNLLSLNDVEHGMLRNSSVWRSLGYFHKLSISTLEKKLRLPLDFRIHFALYCGAASCPVIFSYVPIKIAEQLDKAKWSYLDQEVTLNFEQTAASIPSLFNWYCGDFGGCAGITNLLIHHFHLPQGQLWSIVFKPYNWSVLTGNFSPESKEHKQR
ncbi:MAG: DUF547 domain-containing protein [Chitinophagales bacterium]